MMTKTQKTFFIIATTLCVVALVFGAIGAYFGVSAVITIASSEPSDSFDGALLMVFMVLFMLAAGCFLVASIPFYVTGPLRAPRHAARRTALLMLLAEVLVFLLNVGLFIAGYLIA